MGKRKISRRRAIAGLACAPAAGMLALAAGPALSVGPASAPASRNVERLAFRRDVPVTDAYEVVVCGGGPAGVTAALSAARAGARTLLVEAQAQLGGTGVSGLVSHWLGGRGEGKRWIVGGLFRQMAEEAAAGGFALLPEPTRSKYQPHGWYQSLAAGVPFDPCAMAAYLDRKLAKAGVRVLLCTQVVDACQEGGRITHAVIQNKSGLAAVPGGVVVDATGDADIAARCGCPVTLGRDEDGLMTPASMTFHVDGVDQDALSEYIHKQDSPRFRPEIAKLRSSGEWPFAYDIFISVQLTRKGTMMINTTRLTGVDGTDGRSVSESLARGRAEIEKLMSVMRKHFPGFARAQLRAVATMAGIRETRRLGGRLVLGVQDVVRGKKFEDVVGFSGYGWDLPDPHKPSENPTHGRISGFTPIPLRIMLPAAGPSNLICPGRAVSVERPVLGPLRVAAPCMAMGEAAGLAAAMMAARGGRSPASVDVASLRAELRRQGAVVDEKDVGK